MAELLLESVCKTFSSGVRAVDELSLAAQSGETVVLLGPSGCGKTTTLRLVAGLDLPDRGRILIDGHDLTFAPPNDRRVGMVFDDAVLLPHLSAKDNLWFGEKLRQPAFGWLAAVLRSLLARANPLVGSATSVPRATRQTWDWRPALSADLLQIVNLLEIGDLLDRFPAELSAGQRQRVAIARALLGRPNLLLFDEPLSRLDAPLRLELRRMLRSLFAKLKATVLYVTHDQSEALALADRIAILAEGRLRQFAAPATIHDHPADRFVAGFVGSPPMNFLSGMLRNDDGRLCLFAHDQLIPLPSCLQTLAETNHGRAVYLGIRPRQVRLLSVNSPATDDGAIQLAGNTIFVEPGPDQCVIVVETALGPLTAVCDAAEMPTLGAPVTLRFMPDHSHLFWSDTGVAVCE